MTTQPHDVHRATIHAASDATKAEHSDARFEDLQRRGVAERDATNLRMRIIAGVVATGLIAWLGLTLS